MDQPPLHIPLVVTVSPSAIPFARNLVYKFLLATNTFVQLT
jgi:hypothetical protein